jgi:hypothetical protein
MPHICLRRFVLSPKNWRFVDSMIAGKRDRRSCTSRRRQVDETTTQTYFVQMKYDLSGGRQEPNELVYVCRRAGVRKLPVKGRSRPKQAFCDEAWRWRS